MTFLPFAYQILSFLGKVFLSYHLHKVLETNIIFDLTFLLY